MKHTNNISETQFRIYLKKIIKTQIYIMHTHKTNFSNLRGKYI